jgi:hypothetical protein
METEDIIRHVRERNNFSLLLYDFFTEYCKVTKANIDTEYIDAFKYKVEEISYGGLPIRLCLKIEWKEHYSDGDSSYEQTHVPLSYVCNPKWLKEYEKDEKARKLAQKKQQEEHKIKVKEIENRRKILQEENDKKEYRRLKRKYGKINAQS